MKRFILMALIGAILCGPAAAVQSVNSRAVPDTTDMTSKFPYWYSRALQFLLRDLANILPSDTGGDGINIDSIRSNPDVDSLGGSIVFDTIAGGAVHLGTQTLDTIASTAAGGVVVNDTLDVVSRVDIGGGAVGVAKIDTIGSADTLMIILSTGDSLMIAKDR